MPIKRATAKQRENRITPDAIEAYRSGDQAALHRALALKPWEPSPLEAEPGPRTDDGTAWARAYPKVQALRRQLQGAVDGE